MPSPTPRLVHPVTVQIEPVDKSRSAWDTHAREEVPQLARAATVTLQAQVHWGRQRDQEPSPTGSMEHGAGWLVFTRRGLESAPYTPAPGDRVLTIDGRTVELYLLDAGLDRGQYNSTRHLVRCTFVDRQPRRD